MNRFLTSNERQWRLMRTVVQGVLGVVVANVDLLMGVAVLDPTWRALCLAMVMPCSRPLLPSWERRAILMSEYASEEERWEELREPGYEPAPLSDFKPEEGEDAGFKEVSANGA